MENSIVEPVRHNIVLYTFELCVTLWSNIDHAPTCSNIMNILIWNDIHLRMCIYIYIYISIYLYIYLYLYISLSLYIYICIYIYIHVCIYVFIYIYAHTFVWLNVFFVCSILKHQLNTDKLDENGTCISNAASVSLRRCSI